MRYIQIVVSICLCLISFPSHAIVLGALKFNHKPPPKPSGPDSGISDGLRLKQTRMERLQHKDHTIEGEYRRAKFFPVAKPAVNEPALWVTNNNDITIKVKLETPNPFLEYVIIKATSVDGLLPDVRETRVNFKERVSFGGPEGAADKDYVEFKLDKLREIKVAEINDSWRWYIIEEKQTGQPAINRRPNPLFFTTSKHRIFTVLDSPQDPWYEGSLEKRIFPWVDALAFTITRAGTTGSITLPDAANTATYWVYIGNYLMYDSEGGGKTRYCDGGASPVLDFTAFIDVSKGYNVNCYDCASSVHTMTNLLGGDSKYQVMQPFGYINTKKVVGNIETNNPFYANRDPEQKNNPLPVLGTNDSFEKHGRSFFGNHTFVLFRDKVYDACVGPHLGTFGLLIGFRWAVRSPLGLVRQTTASRFVLLIWNKERQMNFTPKAFLLYVIIGSSLHSMAEQPTSAHERMLAKWRSALGFNSWPGKNGALKKGLRFVPGEHPELAGFFILQDELYERRSDLGIVRRINLSRNPQASGNNEVVRIDILVAHTSTVNVHELLLWIALTNTSIGPSHWSRGDSKGISIGDFNFVHGLNDTQFAFARNNVGCSIWSYSNAGVDVKALAAAIDAKIVALPDLTSAQFNALRPTISEFSPVRPIIIGNDDATPLSISIHDPASEALRTTLRTAHALNDRSTEMQLPDLTQPVTVSRAENGRQPVSLITVNQSLQFSVAKTFVTAKFPGVEDISEPSVTCPPNINAAAPAGSAFATIDPGVAEVIDDIDGQMIPIAVRSDGKELTEPYPVGVTTIVWSATDESGKSASCTQTITITASDTTAPLIVLPANIIAECNACAGTLVNYPPATATDDQTTTPVITYSQASGTLFPLGTTIVKVEARDEAGNLAAGSFAVTIKDGTPPTLTLTCNTARLWPPDHKFETVTLSGTISDACDCGPFLPGALSGWVVVVDSGNGDGGKKKEPDFQNFTLTALDAQGKFTATVELRKERSGSGDGRTYKISVSAKDKAGNSGTSGIVKLRCRKTNSPSLPGKGFAWPVQYGC